MDKKSKKLILAGGLVAVIGGVAFAISKTGEAQEPGGPPVAKDLVVILLFQAQAGKVGFQWSMSNVTDNAIRLDEYSLTFDNISLGWQNGPITVPPHYTSAWYTGSQDPSVYHLLPGGHAAYVEVRDNNGNVYKSNAVTFTI